MEGFPCILSESKTSSSAHIKYAYLCDLRCSIYHISSTSRVFSEQVSLCARYVRVKSGLHHGDHDSAQVTRVSVYSHLKLYPVVTLLQKAIQESESEWMQNKKLIDTRNKGLRKSVSTLFYFNFSNVVWLLGATVYYMIENILYYITKGFPAVEYGVHLLSLISAKMKAFTLQNQQWSHKVKH